MADHAHLATLTHRNPDDQYLETPPGSGYEHTDAHVAPMVKFAVWLVISAIIVHVGLAAMYWLLIRESAERADTARYPLALGAPPRLPPDPRLQQFPGSEMYEHRLREDAELKSYGWVDKNAGTVRIPIDDAKRLILERGLLTSRPQDIAPPSSQVDVFPSDSSSGRTLERRRQ